MIFRVQVDRVILNPRNAHFVSSDVSKNYEAINFNLEGSPFEKKPD